MPSDDDFTGAKIALISQGMLVTYKRDVKPNIPFPGMWDLPGGGREGDETAVECALRETWEEFGLRIDPSSIVWEQRYASERQGGLASYFLVANLAEGAFDAIAFGDEGERWEVMPVEQFLTHPNTAGFLQSRLRDYLVETSARSA